MSEVKVQNNIKYSAAVGSKLAFEEVLRLIDDGCELHFLKAQMIINIGEFEKQLATLSKEWIVE